MQENGNNNQPPEGIDILKSEADGKIYVINEVLNYYQRKLRVLTKEQVLSLAHHVFDIEKLERAKEILHELWIWRKASPSTDNSYLIKNLSQRRKRRGGNVSNAQDIINFFHVEDANLNVIFLTLKCEDIPSKVHESEAMKDVYVLLHKSEKDYMDVMHDLELKSLSIESYSQMVLELKNEMSKGFQALTAMIKRSKF